MISQICRSAKQMVTSHVKQGVMVIGFALLATVSPWLNLKILFLSIVLLIVKSMLIYSPCDWYSCQVPGLILNKFHQDVTLTGYIFQYFFRDNQIKVAGSRGCNAVTVQIQKYNPRIARHHHLPPS